MSSLIFIDKSNEIDPEVLELIISEKSRTYRKNISGFYISEAQYKGTNKFYEHEN